jgi:hypothetical protein
LTAAVGRGQVDVMKSYKLLALVAISACMAGAAQAQIMHTEHGIPDAPTRNTVATTSSTGTILKKELRWRSKIPLNKTYGELTPEQKAVLFAMYESIPEGDEPPFPLTGLKPIFSAIKKGHTA